MKLFLEDDDLYELTGYKYSKKQCEWLSNNGYIFEISGTGRPRVLHQHLVDRMTTKANKVEPDFGALKGK